MHRVFGGREEGRKACISFHCIGLPAPSGMTMVQQVFQGMMKQQVTEKQDAHAACVRQDTQAVGGRAREEAWQRPKVGRMNREREQLARERSTPPRPPATPS